MDCKCFCLKIFKVVKITLPPVASLLVPIWSRDRCIWISVYLLLGFAWVFGGEGKEGLGGRGI